MNGKPTPEVTPAMVAELAALAEVEIDAERAQAIAEQLGELLGPATEVNRFMAGRRDALMMVTAQHRGVVGGAPARVEPR